MLFFHRGTPAATRSRRAVYHPIPRHFWASRRSRLPAQCQSTRQARKAAAGCRARWCRPSASCAASRRTSSTDAVAVSDAVTKERSWQPWNATCPTATKVRQPLRAYTPDLSSPPTPAHTHLSHANHHSRTACFMTPSRICSQQWQRQRARMLGSARQRRRQLAIGLLRAVEALCVQPYTHQPAAA